MDRITKCQSQIKETLFFCNIPDLCSQEIRAFVANCLKEDLSDCIQPSCCRELIFREPSILISPQLETPGRIFIISKNETIDSKKFREQILALSIELESEVDVTPALFQYCLAFTLTQRMAPLWNKMGDFLVQGKGFLEERRKLNAIRLGIKVSDRIYFSLNSLQMKFPPCEIEDFSVSPNVLRRLQNDSDFSVEDTSMENNRCIVIPSLKNAFVTSVSRQIPKTSPFRTYEELRRHWKLMYGYHLPSKSCEEFYNVRFFGEKSFTYPSYCIRSDEPILFQRCDHESIHAAFLHDLSLRMPTACGIAITPSSTPRFQEVKLKKAVCREENFLQLKPRSRIPATISLVNLKTSAAKINTVMCSLRSPESIDTEHAKEDLLTLPSEGKAKLIPSFTKRKNINGSFHLQDRKLESEKKKKKTAPVSNGVDASKQQKKGCNPSKSAKARVLTTKDVPKKTPNAASSTPCCELTFSTERLTDVVTVDWTNKEQAVLPRFQKSNKSSASTLESKQLRLQKDGANKELVKHESYATQSSTPVAKNATNVAPLAERARSTMAIDLAYQILAGASNEDVEVPKAVERTRDLQPIPSNLATKTLPLLCSNAARVRKDNSFPDVQQPVKKPRSRPVVSDNLDMRELAQKNELKKANVATLKSWLKNKGLVVKACTKKDELISMVNKCIEANLPGE